MLERIFIKNVALIDRLELEFSSGLNILSGETGAGKSIIFDCIMLLIGNRYDSSLLRYGATDGIVEGVFSSVPLELYDEIGIERDEIAIITRKFNADGRNEIRINGRNVTLNMLKKFTASLIDIYGQNETQTFFNVKAQAELLDNYIGQELNLHKAELKEILRQYIDIKKAIEDLGDDVQRERNMDLLQYQISEIENAQVKKNEEDELIDRRKLLLSAEKISSCLENASNLLQDNSIFSAIKQIAQIASLSDSYSEISKRLESVSVEISDIADTIETEKDNAVFEENELQQVEDRLKQVREIKRKYGDYEEMQKFLQSAKERYDFLALGADNYIKFSDQLKKVGSKLFTCAEKISKIRKKYALILEKKVVEQLATLGMPRSIFEIRFAETPVDADKITAEGFDSLEFYLSTNPGYPVRPLAKIISGGEASRFMLALKAIEGAEESISTMIFDEIDAGVSGKTGQVVAEKLADIAYNRQVLCITHLAPIAAMADSHYFISKEVIDNATYTHVEKLNFDQSVAEITRLLGAKDISSQSELSAKQLKEWGDNYKNSHNK